MGFYYGNGIIIHYRYLENKNIFNNIERKLRKAQNRDREVAFNPHKRLISFWLDKRESHPKRYASNQLYTKPSKNPFETPFEFMSFPDVYNNYIVVFLSCNYYEPC